MTYGFETTSANGAAGITPQHKPYNFLTSFVIPAGSASGSKVISGVGTGRTLHALRSPSRGTASNGYRVFENYQELTVTGNVVSWVEQGTTTLDTEVYVLTRA